MKMAGMNDKAKTKWIGRGLLVIMFAAGFYYILFSNRRSCDQEILEDEYPRAINGVLKLKGRNGIATKKWTVE